MKSAEGNFNYEPIESNQEEDAMEGNADKYCDLYRDMAALIEDSAVRKLWKVYGGINVTFPTRLYSKDYVRQYIDKNMDQMKPSELARELKLSDRRVRQLIHEIRLAKGNGEPGKSQQ